MEIAFFPVSDMKTDNIAAPQASVADEFSSLLSSMLKTAQSGAPLETGLSETPSENSVLAAVVKDKPFEVSHDSTEAVEENEGEEASVAEAPLIVLPNELAVFSSPVESEAATDASLAVPFNGFFETGLSQKNQTGVPLDVSMTNPPGQGRVADSIAPQRAVTPEAANISAGQTENTPEKARAPKNEKGRIELASALFQGTRNQEHFEVEIPAEEILKHSAEESLPRPAIGASGERAEAQRENVAGAVAFEQDTFEFSGHSNSAEKITTDQVRGQQADMSGFAFNGSEEQESGQNETDASSGQPVQETQAAKPENILNSLGFEKTMDAPVKDSAPSARVAPLAAEIQEKVQAGIKVSVEQGGGEVKMKLNPESLGEVRVKLNVESGLVRAEITVENPEVKRIIESDSSFLRDSLGSQGLTLDKCVVEVGRSFEAGTREKNDESTFSGDEQRPMKDRDEKENRENSGWHRHFRKNYARHEDGGVDFFI